MVGLIEKINQALGRVDSDEDVQEIELSNAEREQLERGFETVPDTSIEEETLKKLIKYSDPTFEELVEIMRQNYCTKALNHELENLRSMNNRLFEFIQQTSDKAIKMVQANVLLLTLLAGIATQIRLDEVYIGSLVMASLGIVLLFLSSLLASWGYFSKSGGIGHSNYEDTVFKVPTEEKYLLNALANNLETLKNTSRLLGKRDGWVRRSIWAFLLGFIILFLSFFTALVDLMMGGFGRILQ